MGHALIIPIFDDPSHLVVELQMDDNSPWTMVKERGQNPNLGSFNRKILGLSSTNKRAVNKCSESSEDGPSI